MGDWTEAPHIEEVVSAVGLMWLQLGENSARRILGDNRSGVAENSGDAHCDKGYFPEIVCGLICRRWKHFLPIATTCHPNPEGSNRDRVRDRRTALRSVFLLLEFFNGYLTKLAIFATFDRYVI
jgi:hypothetical protein